MVGIPVKCPDCQTIQKAQKTGKRVCQSCRGEFNVLDNKLKPKSQRNQHTCPQCHGAGDMPHACPERIAKNNDHETKCTCCPECTAGCEKVVAK